MKGQHVDQPQNADSPGSSGRQGQAPATQDLAGAAVRCAADVGAAPATCAPAPSDATDPPGEADAPERAPPTGHPGAPRADPGNVAGMLSGVAQELVRAHLLSLELQELFSRAVSGMDAGPDAIREAQGLDQLSQTLENLARLLHVIAKAHPRPICTRQMEECLTLRDLRQRLGVGAGEPRQVSGPEPAGASSHGGCLPIATSGAERCTSESGEISWL